jgi:hypothetical protein
VRAALIAAALALTACPPLDDELPCSPCRMRCDQDFGDSCEECRSENCPDMEEASDDQ